MFLNLEKGSMVTMELRKEACLVQCRSGRLWITVAGDPVDHFLEGSEERLFSGPGRVVIETLTRSCMGMHSESDLTLRVNEEYCTLEATTPRRNPSGGHPRSFWRNPWTRPAVRRIDIRTTSV